MQYVETLTSQATLKLENADLSEQELQQLHVQVHNEIVHLSQIANGKAMENSRQELVKQYGVLGNCALLQFDRLLPHTMWSRLDSDVPYDRERSTIQTLEFKLKHIERELQKIPKTRVESLRSRTCAFLKNILPPSFREIK